MHEQVRIEPAGRPSPVPRLINAPAPPPAPRHPSQAAPAPPPGTAARMAAVLPPLQPCGAAALPHARLPVRHCRQCWGLRHAGGAGGQQVSAGCSGMVSRPGAVQADLGQPDATSTGLAPSPEARRLNTATSSRRQACCSCSSSARAARSPRCHASCPCNTSSSSCCCSRGSAIVAAAAAARSSSCGQAVLATLPSAATSRAMRSAPTASCTGPRQPGSLFTSSSAASAAADRAAASLLLPTDTPGLEAVAGAWQGSCGGSKRTPGRAAMLVCRPSRSSGVSTAVPAALLQRAGR